MHVLDMREQWCNDSLFTLHLKIDWLIMHLRIQVSNVLVMKPLPVYASDMSVPTNSS